MIQPPSTFDPRLAWRAAALVLGAVLALAPPVAAQRPVQSRAGAEIDWVARDRRIGFDRSTESSARRDLSELAPGDFGRASALLALGASGTFKGRAILIEETALDRIADERAAAAFGLGELGADRVGEGLDVLLGLATDSDARVVEAALVALIRLGDPRARGAVAELAAGEGEFAETARQVLAHRVDPNGAAIPAAFKRFYRLRWDAARNHGVIDGQIWGQTLLQQLCESEPFLEALILRLVTELGVDGAKDHVLEILLDGQGLGRIGAAIKLMPAEVELMVETGVWQPRNQNEWRWLVTTVLHEEMQPSFPRALAAALPFEFPLVRVMAAGLLYGSDSRFEDILIEAFDGEDVALRAQAAYVVGASEIVTFAPRLRELLDDPNPWVAANAMGALVRMGSPQAATRAVELLATAPEDRAPSIASFLFEVLARSAPDPEVLTFLESIHESLEGPDRAAADSILLINRRPVSADALRRELPLLNPLTVQAFRGAQALGVSPNEQDLQLLVRLFPREGAPDINLEFAAALALQGHRAPEPLLRAAVWKLSFDYSALACGVVARGYGLDTLITWLLDPPLDATDEDVRRVGYAIGGIGGERAVEQLQKAFGTTAGAELPALVGAILGAYSARTR